MPARPFLQPHQIAVIERHFAGMAAAGGGGGVVRVPQWEGVSSVLHAATGRLHLHRHNARKSPLQEYVFESVGATCSALVASGTHRVKLWDLRRFATPRELARMQGFPEDFELPSTHVHPLFGNAVAVPAAAHALRAAAEAVAGGGALASFVDVCAGIGGFHCAARAVLPGATCVGYSEIKPAAARCYEANFPGAPALGDARTARWPAADLVCAGFPCQPFSRASRVDVAAHPDANFALEALVRCLDATRARAVVLENVPQLRTTGRATFEALQAALAARGFRVAHAVLDAKDFGLPQTRRRLYLVGVRGARATPPALAPPPRPARFATFGDILDDEGAGEAGEGRAGPVPKKSDPPLGNAR